MDGFSRERSRSPPSRPSTTAPYGSAYARSQQSGNQAVRKLNPEQQQKYSSVGLLSAFAKDFYKEHPAVAARPQEDVDAYRRQHHVRFASRTAC